MSNLTPRSAELEDRMRTAALRYFELAGTKVFVTPIANTTPGAVHRRWRARDPFSKF